MALAAAGVTAILGFATLDPEEAEMVEREMKETPVMESDVVMVRPEDS